MAIIAGIDEAGFGPVLGPLVVSVTAFSAPDELANECMWSLLSPTVGRRPGQRRTMVAIADSKKLYSPKRKGGLENLERGVLAMLATRGRTPTGLRELLGILASASVPQAEGYPWYAGLELPVPRAVSPTDVVLTGNALAAAMQHKGLRLLTMRSEVILAGEYNRLVEATRNKSATLLDVTCRLLMCLWQRPDCDRIRIYVDQQGGRRHYLPALQRVFRGCEFKIVDEGETLSAYRLTAGPRVAELWFCVRGEERHLTVALASMLSKYLRELFMILLNAFWARHVPDLVPTAGYYVDGRRFFSDIQAAVKKLNVDERLLYRTR